MFFLTVDLRQRVATLFFRRVSVIFSLTGVVDPAPSCPSV